MPEYFRRCGFLFFLGGWVPSYPFITKTPPSFSEIDRGFLSFFLPIMSRYREVTPFTKSSPPIATPVVNELIRLLPPMTPPYPLHSLLPEALQFIAKLLEKCLGIDRGQMDQEPLLASLGGLAGVGIEAGQRLRFSGHLEENVEVIVHHDIGESVPGISRFSSPPTPEESITSWRWRLASA